MKYKANERYSLFVSACLLLSITTSFNLSTLPPPSPYHSVVAYREMSGVSIIDGRSNGKKKEDKEEDKKEEEIEEEETKEEEGEGENKKTAKEGVEQKDIGGPLCLLSLWN